MKPLMIGICGGTGSGKTTLAEQLYAYFQGICSCLAMDCYYKAQQGKSFEERAKNNYDHPDAIDVELLEEHMKALKEGKDILHPTYDFSEHNRAEEWRELKAQPIIIVEGILLFALPQLLELLDVKIYVDTEADVRILRRLLRDVEERGRSVGSVVEQYFTTVKPMHDKFIEPSKHMADIIVPEGGHNVVAIDMLIGSIERLINKEK